MKKHLWKFRYKRVLAKIQDIHEEEDLFPPNDIPSECFSTSKVFYISNDMEVFDSLEAAMRYCQNNKKLFFRVVKK